MRRYVATPQHKDLTPAGLVPQPADVRSL